jgi:hypothetical protein
MCIEEPSVIAAATSGFLYYINILLIFISKYILLPIIQLVSSLVKEEGNLALYMHFIYLI